jgi:hypothetical protein
MEVSFLNALSMITLWIGQSEEAFLEEITKKREPHPVIQL